jgi:hypothetical protein
MPVLVSATTLYETALVLLADVVSCLQQQGLSPPGRQVVYMGTIPADCEQVAVVFGGYIPEPAFDGMTFCSNYRWAGTFSVIITRCTPALPGKNGVAPSAALMNAAAEIASKDAEALVCLVDTVGEHGGDVAINTAAPSGGMQTVSVDIRLPVT